MVFFILYWRKGKSFLDTDDIEFLVLAAPAVDGRIGVRIFKRYFIFRWSNSGQGLPTRSFLLSIVLFEFNFILFINLKDSFGQYSCNFFKVILDNFEFSFWVFCNANKICLLVMPRILFCRKKKRWMSRVIKRIKW